MNRSSTFVVCRCCAVLRTYVTVKMLRSVIKTLRPAGAPTVNVVRINGVITSGRASVNIRFLEKILDRAFGVEGLSMPVAVAVTVNSPGGSTVQSALIGQRIRDLAKETRLPVLGFSEDVAASGGYWVLAAADEIYADGSSIVGSIGVMGGGFGMVEAAKKLGVERRLFTAGEHKVRLDPFSPLKDDDVPKMNGMLRDTHKVFKEYVKSRRGDKIKEEDLVFSGDFFTGEHGVELGLVDKIGHLRAIVKEKYGPTARLNYMSPPWFPFFMRTLEVSSPSPSSWGRGIVSAAAGAMVGHAVDVVQDRLQEEAMRSRYGL